ncbi:MAG: hypothetical protein V3U26_05980 [Dehalococcoidia bacterium]
MTEKLKETAHSLGADLVAVAPAERWNTPPPFDTANIRVYPHSGYLPSELMPSTRSIVVVAVKHLDGVIDTITTDCKTTAVQGNFGYVFLNRRLNEITFGLARRLEELGHRSVPLGSVGQSRYNQAVEENPDILSAGYGIFSLKRAAVLAGLGRKARNGLVASLELGVRMRLGALLTAAELEGDPLLEGDPCPAGCAICMKVCPTQAISLDGRVSHLRCFSDAGRRGVHYEEIKANFRAQYPADLPGVDYAQDEYWGNEGTGNRICKVACFAFCPLGKRNSPDILGRVKRFEREGPKVELRGFPPAHNFVLDGVAGDTIADKTLSCQG